jgi:hypothetical protein
MTALRTAIRATKHATPITKATTTKTSFVMNGSFAAGKSLRDVHAQVRVEVERFDTAEGREQLQPALGAKHEQACGEGIRVRGRRRDHRDRHGAPRRVPGCRVQYVVVANAVAFEEPDVVARRDDRAVREADGLEDPIGIPGVRDVDRPRAVDVRPFHAKVAAAVHDEVREPVFLQHAGGAIHAVPLRDAAQADTHAGIGQEHAGLPFVETDPAEPDELEAGCDGLVVRDPPLADRPQPAATREGHVEGAVCHLRRPA